MARSLEMVERSAKVRVLQSSLWKIGTRASHPLPRTLARLSPSAAAAAAAKKKRRRKMIYDVNSPLFRSFLSQKGGASSDKRNWFL
uniref:Uncharacterized protein n=1 Tax=Aegilops tauschii TaxID=37682 RepID=R7WFJ0_AEGTA